MVKGYVSDSFTMYSVHLLWPEGYGNTQYTVYLPLKKPFMGTEKTILFGVTVIA